MRTWAGIRSAAALACVAGVLSLAEAAGPDRKDIYDTKANGRQLIDDAVAKAKDEGKNVLITWGANWCGWCHHLKEQCDGDERIVAMLEESFVSVRIDLGDRDKHMDLAKEYVLDFDELGIPHMTVLDANGKAFGNLNGGDLGTEVGEGNGHGGSAYEYPADKILAFLDGHQPVNKPAPGD